MTLLIIGLGLFCGVHLLPTVTNLRQILIARLGENGYKGLFSLLVVIGIVLMVIGFPRVELIQIYEPPVWARTTTAIFMLLSLILFAAANMPGNIKRFTRHPMLWGLVFWSVGHLLSNGDKASLILFGGFAIYGFLAMLSANLRGATKQIKKYSVAKDIMVILAGTIVYVVLVLAHPYLFGVAVR